jgi:hypothetical protein
MSVGTTHLVNVSVDDELRCWGITKKVVVKGALEVVEDALYSSEIGLMRILHVETHLLDCLDVRPGEGVILESLGQASVGSRGTDRGTRVGRDLDLSVHGHGTMLVVGHTITLKDMSSVLRCCKKRPSGCCSTKMPIMW